MSDPRDLEDHIYVDDTSPCWNCGEETHFVEINFEAPLCPGRCTDVKWEEYREAQRRTGEWQPW